MLLSFYHHKYFLTLQTGDVFRNAIKGDIKRVMLAGIESEI